MRKMLHTDFFKNCPVFHSQMQSSDLFGLITSTQPFIPQPAIYLPFDQYQLQV